MSHAILTLEMIFEPRGEKTLVTSHEVHDLVVRGGIVLVGGCRCPRYGAPRVAAFKAGEAGFTSYPNQRTLMTVIANLYQSGPSAAERTLGFTMFTGLPVGQGLLGYACGMRLHLSGHGVVPAVQVAQERD